MSAASDRTARLRYCNTEGQGLTSCCYPKKIGIDPLMNTVCLGEECNTIKIDPSYNRVVTDLSGATIIADLTGVTTTLDLANPTGDAFGRLRASNPYTLFEFSSISGKLPMVIDEATSGGGTSTWSVGDSHIEMTVPPVNGASVIRQTHDYIVYQPGKSKLIMMTGVLYDNAATDASGITARIGSFDTTIGGIYIQYSNGTVSVVLKKGTGTIAVGETVVPRSLWTDPLNGSGPSGVTVDFSKAQIFVFDMEWLGVGQIRCGIVQGGQIYYYYAFTHADTLETTYVQTAKLPMRYEITSNGSANTMRMICGTVISEGGFSAPGRTFMAINDTSAMKLALNNSNTYMPIMSLRLRAGNPFIRGTIKVKGVDLFNTNSNIAGSWKIMLNPTITGVTATWTDVDSSNSIVEIRRENGGGAITSEGRVLYQQFYSTRANSEFLTSVDDLVAAQPIASDIAGNRDIVTLAVNWLAGSNNSDIYASMQWIELI